jgi:hypothetical protein
MPTVTVATIDVMPDLFYGTGTGRVRLFFSARGGAVDGQPDTFATGELVARYTGTFRNVQIVYAPDHAVTEIAGELVQRESHPFTIGRTARRLGRTKSLQRLVASGPADPDRAHDSAIDAVCRRRHLLPGLNGGRLRPSTRSPRGWPAPRRYASRRRPARELDTVKSLATSTSSRSDGATATTPVTTRSRSPRGTARRWSARSGSSSPRPGFKLPVEEGSISTSSPAAAWSRSAAS